MSVTSKIPYDHSSSKYKASWQATQEDQVSFVDAHSTTLILFRMLMMT